MFIGILDAHCIVTLPYMLHEVRIQLNLPLLLCLVLCDGQHATVKQLIPPQCPQISDTGASKDAHATNRLIT